MRLQSCGKPSAGRECRGPLYFSHERYLVNQLRKRFGFEGTPIELKIRGRAKRSERKPLK